VNVARLETSLAGVVLLLAPGFATAQVQSQPQQSPAELVKAVIANELKPSDSSDTRWKYRLDKETDGKLETRQVVETQSGSIDRLLSVAGKPLSDAQARDEAGRILRLVHDPDERHKAEQSRQKDLDQCNAFMKMIPDAFIFEYAGQSGSLTKVTFNPNPKFRPPSREGKVLQQMAGEIWVDAKQLRLASIRGQLMNDVKFAGGLLGHLEKGGQFWVKRVEIAAGDWELTDMKVDMHGKALLFKNICVQQKELHSDFERVPENLSLVDAANLLLHQNLVAFRQ
jgi:hypothetical protein